MAAMSSGGLVGGWEQHERRRGHARTLAAAATVVGAAIVVASAVGGDEAAPELAVEDVAVPVESVPAEDVRHLPAAPVEGRAAAVHAWTGDELLVWGGLGMPRLDAPQNFHADGAAFDPATGRWRALPPAPLTPRIRPAHVWTGDRLVVWGGADAEFSPLADGAVYIPAEDRWEPLPPAPLSGRAGAVAEWTGHEVLVVGGFRPVGAPERLDPTEPLEDGAAFDPTSGTWRMLPAPPDDIEPRMLLGAVWTGDRLVVWEDGRGAFYRPADDRWQPLDLPLEATAPRGLTVLAPLDDGRVALFGVQPAGSPPASGVVYDLDSRLAEAIPPAEPHEPVWPPRLVAAGDRVVLLPNRLAAEGLPDRRAVVWDVAARSWSVTPPLTRGRSGYAAVWTGEEFLLWGGFDGRRVHADGLRWRPDGAV